MESTVQGDKSQADGASGLSTGTGSGNTGYLSVISRLSYTGDCAGAMH
jgi:hypothetical protein